MQPNNKIAIVLHVPASFGGGGFTDLKNQVFLLSKDGYNIDVHEPKSVEHPDFGEGCLFVDYDDLKHRILNRIGLGGFYPLFLNMKFQNDYDYVLTYSPYYVLFLFRNRKKIRLLRKLIISSYDVMLPESNIRKILRLVTLTIYKILNFGNVVLNAENSIVASKLSGLYNTIFLAPPLLGKYTPMGCKINERFTVLFLGDLVKRKGRNTLIKLLSTIQESNILFFIAGRLQEDDPILSQFSWNKNIIFLGKVSESTKLELLQNADLGLMLSLQESYSLVTREMLLSGIPVISTWSPSIRIFGKYGIILSTKKTLKSDLLNIYKKWSSDPHDYINWKYEIHKIANSLFVKKELEENFLKLFND